jgi:hypothetical protein
VIPPPIAGGKGCGGLRSPEGRGALAGRREAVRLREGGRSPPDLKGGGGDLRAVVAVEASYDDRSMPTAGGEGRVRGAARDGWGGGRGR